MAVVAVVIVMGGGNNSDYGNNYGGGYNGGNGNGPRERLRKEPREILPTEKRGIPLKALNIKGSINGGNKDTL